MNQEKNRFFIAGGALRFDAPSYAEREADRQLQEYVAAGELCYVLTTRQMGKTSLMVRTATCLQEQNIQTTIIDLTSIGTAPIDAWFLSVLDDLQSQLSLATDVEEWWEENSSLSQVKRFTKFIQEIVPQEVVGQVAIFIDEIDAMLNLDFADDFFAAIRAIYNRRASLLEEQCVSFVLLGVAAPNDLIKDQTKTPFNVGQRISLEELSLEEAQVLLRGLPGESLSILERIFFWTSGHPYLTQKIGLAITREEEREWTDSAIDDLVERLFLTDEAFHEESNLQFVRARILFSSNKKELLALYRKVHEGKEIRSNEQSIFQSELKLYGLLRTSDKKCLTIRNLIYHRVFDLDWIKENTPINLWRWAAVGAAVFSILTTIFLVVYWQQAPEPDELLYQSYTTDFRETINPTLRLANLANVFALDGYESDAARLFNDLTINEQIAMFDSSTPDLSLQVKQVAQGTYATLVERDILITEESTRVLQAMLEALDQSTDADSRALRDEISIWVEGRRYVENGENLSAKTAYDLAISLNNDNPATHFERALIAVLSEDHEAALGDLIIVWGYGAAWEHMVQDAVNKDPELRASALAMEKSPPFIRFVFKPTPVSTATPRPRRRIECEDMKAELVYEPSSKWSVIWYQPNTIRHEYNLDKSSFSYPNLKGTVQLFSQIEVADNYYPLILDQHPKYGRSNLLIDTNLDYHLTWAEAIRMTEPESGITISDPAYINVGYGQELGEYGLIFYYDRSPDKGVSKLYYYRELSRRGCVRLGDKKYAIFLLDKNANGLFDELQNDLLAIDLNNDNNFDLASDEIYRMNSPFLVDGRCYRVTNITPSGDSIEFEEMEPSGFSGKIINSESGAVIQDARVEVFSSQIGNVSGNAESSTDVKVMRSQVTTTSSNTGEFYVAACPKEYDLIRVSHPEFLSEDSRRIYNLSEEGPLVIDIYLDPIEKESLSGIVELNYEGSYHFLSGVRGQYSGGDFYLLQNNGLRFYANNSPQRGIIMLPDIGTQDLESVEIPLSGYTPFGVDVVKGRTYVALARMGEEGHFIVFRVLDISNGKVRVKYRYVYR